MNGQASRDVDQLYTLYTSELVLKKILGDGDVAQ